MTIVGHILAACYGAAVGWLVWRLASGVSHRLRGK